MGRWGHCLFGYDATIGHAIMIIQDITQGDDRQFAYMMGRVLVGSPLGVIGYYVTEYSLAENISGEVDDSINQLIRHKLDSGLGDELFEKYRALHVVDILGLAKTLPIVFGALMMEYGATIKEDHIKYLRDLVPEIQSSEGTMAILADCGFRGPGKRQFLAALDNYQAGEPRSFHQPSCHGCGKVNSDIKPEGKTLLKCGGCKNEIAAAWFCDKDCQRGLWKHHKHICGDPLGRGLATFQAHGKNSFGPIIYKGANV